MLCEGRLLVVEREVACRCEGKGHDVLPVLLAEPSEM